MRKLTETWNRSRAFILAHLPERQIYFRTNGKVHFFRVSTRQQLVAASAAAFMVIWLTGASTAVLIRAEALIDSRQQVATKDAEIAQIRDRYEDLEHRVQSLQQTAEVMQARIEKRQQFFESMMAGDVQAAAVMLTAKGTPDDTRLGGQSSMGGPIDELTPDEAAVLNSFEELEKQQLDYVGQARAMSDARFEEHRKALRKLGINPDRLLRRSSLGEGGPFSGQMVTPGGLEPQFRDLFQSWQKLDTLEKAMMTVPATRPVNRFTFTSSYGVRYDPFNGRAAMHAGVDLAGRHGEPVYATAAGKVKRAGRYGAYGNLVIIDHGNGITTRYGHLSRIHVRPGQQVSQGDKIAAMGSTGRSTGTHLHYEVRLDGRAVNPMPFMEASSHVLEVQRRANSAKDA